MHEDIIDGAFQIFQTGHMRHRRSAADASISLSHPQSALPSGDSQTRRFARDALLQTGPAWITIVGPSIAQNNDCNSRSIRDQ